MSSELTPVQRLAVAQAVYRRVGAIVSTKDPDSLRAQCDADMRANFENTGAKSYDVVIDGSKVGTYSVKTSKPKKNVDLRVVDMKAYVEWCCQNSCMTTDDAQARRKFEETGEVPDGCEVVEIETAGGYSGTVLKVDEEAVADAVGGLLPSTIAGLLEDGE